MQFLATTTERRFRLLPIAADPLNPCVVPVLADLHRLLALAVHSRPRTRVLRFDLNAAPFQCGHADESLLQGFMRGYGLFLAERGIDRQYAWTRSDRMDGSFAYRMVFMLDASGPDTTPELLDGGCRCWAFAAGPSALFDPCCDKTYRFPMGNGVLVDTSEPDWEDARRYAFRWSSCISLAQGVGLQPFGARPFGCSIPATAPTPVFAASRSAPDHMGETPSPPIQRNPP
jgi:hypothetical protein